MGPDQTVPPGGRPAAGGLRRLTGGRRIIGACAFGVLLLAAASACGGEDGPGLVTTTSQVVTTAGPTTTTSPPISTTAASTTTVEDPAADTTEPPQEEEDAVGEPDDILYSVVRQESTRDGNRLFVAISPGDYTEVDLENLVVSVYEERDNLYELHVFDNREAVEALTKAQDERTDEEAALLDRHYLVSLLEGDTIRFQGPFADLPGFRIGS